MQFTKYHGLGNDYLVMSPEQVGRNLTKKEIITICHRHYGIGSDGILWGPIQTKDRCYGLRIFNPDGSEAEKSGNGLRIFSRYLWDQNLVQSDQPFLIDTPGGRVKSKVMNQGKTIVVEMGRVSFDSNKIPVEGSAREVLNETIAIHGKEYLFCAATIGNPHCVLPMKNISETLARSIGPLIEIDPRFPNRTNVQFMSVIDRNNIQIEIWERGAGYTLASGSSSAAAAAVAYKLNLCDQNIKVHMPGGVLEITIGQDYEISMIGPVTKVGSGIIEPEIFDDFPRRLL